MISDSSFVGCRDLPPEMAARLDQPWTFLGTTNRERFDALCACCAPEPVIHGTELEDPSFQAVYFRSFGFVTDDMIHLLVFFGVCERCEAVYWAHSGPPFRRVSAFVPA